ncbi:MAG: hypothetical protein MO853_03550 [Candidatus Protistobacter heckmanni]|nr:hypothetical protein [Candidatus Protistobacter heckmanni]
MKSVVETTKSSGKFVEMGGSNPGAGAGVGVAGAGTGTAVTRTETSEGGVAHNCWARTDESHAIGEANQARLLQTETVAGGDNAVLHKQDIRQFNGLSNEAEGLRAQRVKFIAAQEKNSAECDGWRASRAAGILISWGTLAGKRNKPEGAAFWDWIHPYYTTDAIKIQSEYNAKDRAIKASIEQLDARLKEIADQSLRAEARLDRASEQYRGGANNVTAYTPISTLGYMGEGGRWATG